MCIYVHKCVSMCFYAPMITAIREMTTDFAMVLQSVCDFHYGCSFIIIHSFTPCSPNSSVCSWCMYKPMNRREDADHCVSLFKGIYETE